MDRHAVCDGSDCFDSMNYLLLDESLDESFIIRWLDESFIIRWIRLDESFLIRWIICYQNNLINDSSNKD